MGPRLGGGHEPGEGDSGRPGEVGSRWGGNIAIFQYGRSICYIAWTFQRRRRSGIIEPMVRGAKLGDD
jgi:hypothetical protein